MPFVCQWPLDSIPFENYRHSVEKALGDYITEARETNRYDVLNVLARHQRGEYRRCRKLVPIHI
jgi:molybdopterin synthase catalytic subunit